MSRGVFSILVVCTLLGCGDKSEVEDDEEEVEDEDDDGPGPEWSNWYPDQDGDGFGDDAQPVDAASAPDGHVAQGGDCDDTDPDVHPEADEVCNDGVDDDCDGLADDDDDSLSTDADDEAYEDLDGDGYGGTLLTQCDHSGLVDAGGDCDDDDSAVSPDAVEDCSDGIDQDCDGLLDCEDGECVGIEPCVEGLGTCNDGVDNDEDGLRDCADDECWDLGLCGEVRVQVTGADGQFHHRFSSSDYGNTPGVYFTYVAEERHTMVFTGVHGRFSIVRPSGSSSCGWTLANQSAVWLKERWSGTGRSFVDSVTRSGFSADSSCYLVDADDFMISDMAPTDWGGLPDGLVVSSADHSSQLWASALGWSGTTSIGSSHFRGYTGSDGYGSPRYYSTGWWKNTMTRNATYVAGGDTWVWNSVYVGAGP